MIFGKYVFTILVGPPCEQFILVKLCIVNIEIFAGCWCGPLNGAALPWLLVVSNCDIDVIYVLTFINCGWNLLKGTKLYFHPCMFFSTKNLSRFSMTLYIDVHWCQNWRSLLVIIVQSSSCWISQPSAARPHMFQQVIRGMTGPSTTGCDTVSTYL